MLNMLKRVIIINKYIIQICKAEVIKVVLQGVINIALKSAWAIAYTKGYNSIFKLAKAQYKYSFLFIIFPYLEMVKGGNNIKLSINFSLAKPLKGLIYKQYQVSVLNCNSIKSSIVNAELDTSFWLFSKKNRGGC